MSGRTEPQPAFDVTTSSPIEVRLFIGAGSRQNRVHVFDQRTGSYLTSGFTRGSVLFVRRPIAFSAVVIREFAGRCQVPSDAHLRSRRSGSAR